MSTKIKESIKIIVDLVNAGKNVVVWAVFIKTINMIKHHLDKLIDTNISQKIYGEVDNEQRDTIINAFNKGEIKGYYNKSAHSCGICISS